MSTPPKSTEPSRTTTTDRGSDAVYSPVETLRTAG
jgi:hypothetical protein